MDEHLPEKLRRLLGQPLPGAEATARYRPQADLAKHHGKPPERARPAAVLVLLYPHQGQWHVALTVRGDHLDHHAGQVSLPGGAVEPGETSAEAALREFHEELGADDLEIRLLGHLTPLYVSVSNYLVEPWVGTAQERGCLEPNQDEVEQLLEVPLADLLDPNHWGSHERERDGRRFMAPHFSWHSCHIWGATCMILGELVTILRDSDLRGAGA